MVAVCRGLLRGPQAPRYHLPPGERLWPRAFDAGGVPRDRRRDRAGMPVEGHEMAAMRVRHCPGAKCDMQFTADLRSAPDHAEALWLLGHERLVIVPRLRSQ